MLHLLYCCFICVADPLVFLNHLCCYWCFDSAVVSCRTSCVVAAAVLSVGPTVFLLHLHSCCNCSCPATATTALLLLLNCCWSGCVVAVLTVLHKLTQDNQDNCDMPVGTHMATPECSNPILQLHCCNTAAATMLLRPQLNTRFLRCTDAANASTFCCCCCFIYITDAFPAVLLLLQLCNSRCWSKYTAAVLVAAVPSVCWCPNCVCS